jgi:hypothetical protein
VKHYRIELPWATFGVGSKHGVIVEAPPIARWARGKRRDIVLDYYRGKGAIIQKLDVR